MKNVVLIRHGQSMGQTASRRGISRKDPSLHDCSLRQKGIQQAYDLRKDPLLTAYNFDLVCTSPLMRAISTCAIGLGHIVTEKSHMKGEDLPTEFVVRVELSEFGSGIPENSGRPIEELSKILRRQLKVEAPDSLMCLDNFDFSTIPGTWPNAYSDSHRIRKFIAWLQHRDEKNIAVVCHSLVIKTLLNNRIGSIPNCVPIECVLACDGQLELKTDCWLESAESSNEGRASSKRTKEKKKKR